MSKNKDRSTGDKLGGRLGLDAIKASPRGYLLVLGGLASLALIAAILTLIYRETPKSSEVLDRARRANAQFVSFAVVFGNVQPTVRDRIIQDITTDVGADTARTDFVLGSTLVDPWCANLTEYKRQLRHSMKESAVLPIGKQTLLLSMITGLLTKSDLKARVYLIGDLNDDGVSEKETRAIVTRTEQTVAALAWRSGARAPVTVISYMDITASTANAQYVRMYRDKGFTFIER